MVFKPFGKTFRSVPQFRVLDSNGKEQVLDQAAFMDRLSEEESKRKQRNFETALQERVQTMAPLLQKLASLEVKQLAKLRPELSPEEHKLLLGKDTPGKLVTDLYLGKRDEWAKFPSLVHYASLGAKGLRSLIFRLQEVGDSAAGAVT
jgi:hypothetical protein